MGDCEEEQLFSGEGVREKPRRREVQQGAKQPLEPPLLQAIGYFCIVNPKSHFIFCSFALKIWFLIESLFQLGLANKKTVSIQAGKDQSVLLATTKTRKQNKPAALLHKSVLKKDFRRMANAVNDQVNKFTDFHLFKG